MDRKGVLLARILPSLFVVELVKAIVATTTSSD
jgi:hypothetical protein